MFFPVSGVETPLWLPPLVAFAISFFTSQAGVSGAFLLLPFQVSVLGYTSPSVSATNQIFNIVAIPGGIYRFVREKRLMWPLTLVVVAGTVPGVLLGVWIRIILLPDPRYFKLFVGAVLLYIGALAVNDLFTRKGGTQDDSMHKNPGRDQTIITNSCSVGRIAYTFQGRQYHFLPGVVVLLCFIVGIIGGIYGIGGGAIVAPFLVLIFKLPVHTVAGAALAGTLITSMTGISGFYLFAHFYPEMALQPDWLLGLLFGAGGILGIYGGARCQKHVPATAIKALLGVCVLFTALKYVIGFFL